MPIPDSVVALPLKEDGAADPEWTLELSARPSRGVFLENQTRLALRRSIHVFLLRRKYRLRLSRRVDTVLAAARDAPDPALAYVVRLPGGALHRYAVPHGPVGYTALRAQNIFEISAAASSFLFPKSAYLATFELALGPRVLRSPPFAAVYPYQYQRRRPAPPADDASICSTAAITQ